MPSATTSVPRTASTSPPVRPSPARSPNSQKGRILVRKETLPDGSPQQFTVTPNWGAAFQLGDGQQHDSGLLGPGVYTVTETVPDGWTLTSSPCSDNSTPDNINLGAGETVTCTFTNTQLVVAPTCNGQTATIYVNAQGRVVGGPDTGKLYTGKLRGTSGADVIVGTGGNDDIDANGGNDTVCGGGGNDVLEGAGGHDRLLGEDGNDTLVGAGDNDTLTGGLGADKFQGGSGRDTATDFTPAQGDTKTGVEVF